MRKVLFLLGAVLFSLALLLTSSFFFNVPFSFNTYGEKIDEFRGIPVYFNGESHKVHGRNVSPDGYNIGLKWQCVEFVKRYYLEIYSHKMPVETGNAKDFYDSSISDGGLNPDRGLMQFSNPSNFDFAVGDILIFDGFYGHMGIVSSVSSESLEIVQQNVDNQSRRVLEIDEINEQFSIKDSLVLGRLRKPLFTVNRDV